MTAETYGHDLYKGTEYPNGKSLENCTSAFEYFPLRKVIAYKPEEPTNAIIYRYTHVRRSPKSSFGRKRLEISHSQYNFDPNKKAILEDWEFLTQITPSLAELCELMGNADPKNTTYSRLLIDDILEGFEGNKILYIRMGSPYIHKVNTHEKHLMLSRTPLFALDLDSGEVYRNLELMDYAPEKLENWIDAGCVNHRINTSDAQLS